MFSPLDYESIVSDAVEELRRMEASSATNQAKVQTDLGAHPTLLRGEGEVTVQDWLDEWRDIYQATNDAWVDSYDNYDGIF